MKELKREDSDYQHAISMLKGNSIELGVKKLEQLSKDGDGHADAILGSIFEFGRGSVQKNERLALAYYERSISKAGSLMGWMGIGRISLIGPHDLRDEKRAYESFLFAAKNSDYPQAWLALGDMYLYGQGIPKDIEQAAACFRKAANDGNVHGYVGLARADFRRGKIFSSLKHRMTAFIQATRLIKTESNDSDRLKKW